MLRLHTSCRGAAGALGFVLLTASCVVADRTSSDSIPVSADSVAFVGVNVLPITDEADVLPDHTVLVQGGRIVAMKPRTMLALPAGVLRIDGTGKYLMPGLADMHVHLEYFDTPEVLKLFLVNGVTTVRNMDGRPHILEWRRQIAASELLGPTIITAGPVLDGAPPVLPDNTVVRDATEARAAVLAQHAAGYDFIKLYINLSPAAYRAVLATARELGLPVAGHVPRRIELSEALASGQHSIEHLTDYDEWIESDDSPHRGRWHWSKLYLGMPASVEKMRSAAERIARSDIWTAPTLVQANRAVAQPNQLSTWMAAPEMAFVDADVRAQWEGQVRRITERMDAEDWPIVARGAQNRKALVRELYNVGARLLIGTDTPNPFVVPGFSIHEELENFIEAGVSPGSVLAIATREAARFLEATEWGTIEVGKRADLILLEDDPRQNISSTRQPAGVMVRGRWFSKPDLQAIASTLRRPVN